MSESKQDVIQDTDDSKTYREQSLEVFKPDWSEFLKTFQANTPQQITKIRKQNVFDDDSKYKDKLAFVLFDVISEEESQFFQNEANRLGFKPMEGYTATYRTNSRVIIQQTEISKEILKRIEGFIPASMQSIYSTPVDQNSVWKLKEMNDNFRFCKYVPGQFFKAHHDGYFQRSLTEKSMLTFMIYLNGDFQGGSTNFLDEDLTPDQDRILKKLNPTTGMTLIFQHNMLHEGDTLISGSKYLMRSDILYEREQQLDSTDPKVQARELMSLAEFYETQGQPQKSVELYKKALALDPSCLN